MALIFNETNAALPQTHLLIIGVGRYPFLMGGNSELEQTSEYLRAIGQLTSPAHSAKLFCEESFRLHQIGAWMKPLGSIDVLTDLPVDNLQEGVDVEEPTRMNISRAYAAWKQRCNQHKDNVALFYFAGHGYGGPMDHYLMPSDIGNLPGEPFREAIDFNSTRAAFHNCQAQTQLFFVDTCRSIPLETILFQYRPTPLDAVAQLQGECEYPLTLLSTANNMLAYGPKNAPSFFASAVLKGLSCYGAENLDDQWKITIDGIRIGINKWIGMEYEKDGNKQRCISTSGSSVEIIKLPAAPKAWLHVDCNPDLAMTVAKLSCEGESSYHERHPLPEPWEVELDAGYYKLEASFDGNEYGRKTNFAKVHPPLTKHILKW